MAESQVAAAAAAAATYSTTQLPEIVRWSPSPVLATARKVANHAAEASEEEDTVDKADAIIGMLLTCRPPPNRRPLSLHQSPLPPPLMMTRVLAA